MSNGLKRASLPPSITASTGKSMTDGTNPYTLIGSYNKGATVGSRRA